jgi:hypothetical protein
MTGEILVNTATELTQTTAASAVLSDGRFVVTWTSTEAGDIRGRLFAADGTPVTSSEFTVDSPTINGTSSSVAALADGRFVVTWTSLSSGQREIWGQTFSTASDGTVSAEGARIQINTGSGNDQQSSVTALSDGSFFVSWTSLDGATGSYEIRGRLFDATGHAIAVGGSTNEFVVNTTLPSDQVLPVAAAFGNGRFAVVWTSGNAEGSPEIRGRVFEETGSPAAGASGATDFVVAEGGQFAAIAVLPQGKVVVTWADEGGSILGRIVAADGQSHVDISLGAGSGQSSIASLGNGQFVVVWAQQTAVHGRILNGDGSDAANGEFIVNTANLSEPYPRVTSLGNGQFVVTWDEFAGFTGSGGATSDIHARIFSVPAEAVPTITIEATDGTGTEAADGSPDFVFTFTRTGDLSQTLSVNYNILGTFPNSAFSGQDFNATSSSVTFAAGSATATLSFDALNDTQIEGSENFAVSIVSDSSSPLRYAVGAASVAAGTVIDDDAGALPTVSIAAPAGAVTEGGILSFTVTRTGDVSQLLVVNLASASGSASNFDFIAPSQVVFAAGNATAVVNVQSFDDTKVEGSETFTLFVMRDFNSLPRYVVGGQTSAAGAILDNDTGAPPVPPPTITIEATDGSGTEAIDGGPDFTFTFTRTGDLSQALSVNFNIVGAFPTFASAGQDFAVPAPPFVTFAAGSATATLTFNALDDAQFEGQESFTVSIVSDTGAPQYVVGAQSSAAGSIIDNEVPPPTITIAATDGSGTEAIDGSPDFIFTFTRTGDLSQALSINYSIFGVSSNSATSGQDFNAISASVTFAAGSATATLAFDALDDALIEGSEDFTVAIQSDFAFPQRYLVGAQSVVTGTVIDDDAGSLPTVSIATPAAAVAEGGILSFTVTRSGDLSQSLTVNLGTASGSASSFDFALPTVQAVFAAGAATAIVNVQTFDDTRVEGAETFTLSVVRDFSASPRYVVGGQTSAVGTIVDNDTGGPPVSPPTITIAATDGSGTEAIDAGPDFIFTFTRTGDLSQALSVNYSIFGTGQASAFAGQDFTAPSPPFVMFAAGSATAILAFDALEDTQLEGQESFTVSIAQDFFPQSYLVGAQSSATGIIIDNEVPLPTITIEATDGTGTEALDGSPDFTFTVRRTGDLSQALSVDYNIFGTYPSAAIAGQDFSAQSFSSVTFAAGSATATLAFDALDDSLIEGPEGFTISIASSSTFPQRYVLGAQSSAVGTVIDDDAGSVPTVSIAAPVGGVAEGGVLSFTATRTGDLSQSLMVYLNLTTTFGSAGSFDFSAPTQAIFAAGEATAVIDVQTFDDTQVEGSESVTISVFPDFGNFPPRYVIGGQTSAVGTILDNDTGTPPVPAPTITIEASDGTGTEAVDGGPDFTFTFTRTGDLSRALSVGYNIVLSGPTASFASLGQDFAVPPPPFVMFAAGSATATLTFDALDDSLLEGPESFTISIASDQTFPQSYVVGAQSSATGTIIDDEVPPPTITIEATDGSGTEAIDGSPDFTFTFRRTGDLSQALSVDYSIFGTYPSFAFAGQDFSVPSVSSATFAAGSATATLSFDALDDTLIEGPEGFTVSIFPNLTFPQRYLVGAQSSAVGTIIDDDAGSLPTVSIAAPVGAVVEGGILSFTLTRTGDLSQSLAVSLATTLGSATSFDLAAPTQVVFAAGEATAIVDVQTFDDTKVEGSESFTILVAPDSGYPPHYVIGGQTSASGLILDNDTGTPPVPPPTITIEATDGSGTEAIDDGPDFTFTFTRTGDLSRALSVDYSIFYFPPIAGSASLGQDFAVPPPPFVMFAAGSATATLTFDALDDSLLEGPESFTVSIASDFTIPQSYIVGTQSSATGTIIDNEVPPPTITIEATDGNGTEAIDGGPDFTFTFTRTGDLSQALSVNYSTFGASLASAFAGQDFDAPSFSAVTFAAGSATATLTFDALDDTLLEGPEGFTVSISPDLDTPRSYIVGAQSSAAGLVIDDDAGSLPTVSIAALVGAVVEGGILAFTVTRTGDLSQSLTVNLTTALGSAGSFDLSAPTQAVFAAGEATAVVNIQTFDDTKVEGSESLTIAVTPDFNYPPRYVVGSLTPVAGTIIDNDTGTPPVPAPTITIEATDGSGTEEIDGGPDFTFTFTRTGDLSQALSVDYYINLIGPPPIASSGLDFNVPSPPFVMFAAGSATATLTFDALHDALLEGPESFTVTIAPDFVFPQSYVVGAQASATGTIIDGPYADL